MVYLLGVVLAFLAAAVVCRIGIWHWSRLYRAIEAGDETAMRCWLRWGGRFHLRTKGVGSLLLAAIHAPDQRVLEILLAEGVDPNTRVSHLPILSVAARVGHGRCVQVLLHSGAEATYWSCSGGPLLDSYTGRIVARHFGDEETAEAKLDAFWRLFVANRDSAVLDTILSSACRHGDLATARLLIDEGIRPGGWSGGPLDELVAAIRADDQTGVDRILNARHHPEPSGE